MLPPKENHYDNLRDSWILHSDSDLAMSNLHLNECIYRYITDNLSSQKSMKETTKEAKAIFSCPFS